MKNPIIVIIGPTASGKTELSIKLAKKFSAKGEPARFDSRLDSVYARLAESRRASGRNGAEIINADSRMIYKELNIGVDKPLQSKKEKVKRKKGKRKEEFIVNGIFHHLIDFLKPTDTFSIARYQKMAQKKIKEIQKKEKTPIIVGGSPLYLDSLLYKYELSGAKPDLKERRKLEKKSLKNLLSEIEKINPGALEKIDTNNKRRVIRALETLKSSGEIKRKKLKRLPQNILILGIKTDREKLYRKINNRVDLMIKNGLVREVKKLYKKYGEKSPALSGIGYHEIIKSLKKEISLDDAIELIKRDSRRLAKRQLAWFRRSKSIKWVSSQKQAEREIKRFLEQ